MYIVTYWTTPNGSESKCEEFDNLEALVAFAATDAEFSAAVQWDGVEVFEF